MIRGAVRAVVPILLCALTWQAAGAAELTDEDRQFITEVVDLVERYHGEVHDRTALLAEAERHVLAELGKPGAEDETTPPTRTERGIKAFIETLGPHNFYATARQYEVRKNWFKGAPKARLGLIGTTIPSGFAVRMVYPGGPAQKAGVTPDDVIIAIDGKPLAGLTSRQVASRLQGEIGQTARLLLRHYDASEEEVTARYTETDTESVLSRRFGKAGYLWVRRFNRQTRAGLEAALAELSPYGPGIEPLDGLVIDLRNNQGGYLNEAVAMADVFLDSGQIAEVDSRFDEKPRIYKARPGAEFEGLPVVMLVNAVSRSSAEIFASALRDNGRAVLMGQTTYGKGVGQRTYRVKATGGSLTLVRSYVTPPSGESFNGKGLEPDIMLARGDANGVNTSGCPPLDAPFRDPEIACAVAYLQAGSMDAFHNLVGGDAAAGPPADLPKVEPEDRN